MAELDNPWAPGGRYASDWGGERAPALVGTAVDADPLKNEDRKQLRLPFKVNQEDRNTCWASALESFLRTVTVDQVFGNIGLLIDRHPEFAKSAVIERARAMGAARGQDWIGSDGSLLETSSELMRWSEVLNTFGIYTTKYPPGAYTIKNVRDAIDSANYVLVNYIDPLWTADRHTFSHCLVIFGYMRSSSEFLCMNPDGGRFETRDLAGDVTYWVSPRAETVHVHEA